MSSGNVIRDVSERSAAAFVATEALMSDPGWNAVVPDVEKRRAALRTLMAVASGYHASEVRVAVVNGKVAGVAVRRLGRDPAGESGTCHSTRHRRTRRDAALVCRLTQTDLRSADGMARA